MDTKDLDKIEQNLIKVFKNQQKIEEIEQKSIAKSFKPVISAINKIEEKIGNVIETNQNLVDLVPVVNKFADISIPETEDENFEFELPASTPFRRINDKVIIEESTMLENVASPNTLNIILGNIAQKYLP